MDRDGMQCCSWPQLRAAAGYISGLQQRGPFFSSQPNPTCQKIWSGWSSLAGSYSKQDWHVQCAFTYTCMFLQICDTGGLQIGAFPNPSQPASKSGPAGQVWLGERGNPIQRDLPTSQTSAHTSTIHLCSTSIPKF